mgnify:CR=1 FL=1
MNHENDNGSLILFLETCAADYGGRVDIRRVNSMEMDIIEIWKKAGYIDFGRIVVEHHNKQGTHWVELSKDAIKDAHFWREKRIKRMLKNRRYKKTGETE